MQKNPVDHEIIHCMPCRSHMKVCLSTRTWSLRPTRSTVKWSGMVLVFSTNGDSRFQWSQALTHYCTVPLSRLIRWHFSRFWRLTTNSGHVGMFTWHRLCSIGIKVGCPWCRPHILWWDGGSRASDQCCSELSGYRGCWHRLWECHERKTDSKRLHPGWICWTPPWRSGVYVVQRSFRIWQTIAKWQKQALCFWFTCWLLNLPCQ